MDPRDIDFSLRSGHDLVNPTGPVDWNNAYTMMALTMVFTEKATIDAGTYAQAAGRNVVTAKDMQLALMYNALPSTGFWNQDNMVEKVGEWRARLIDGMDMSSSDEEEQSEQEDDEDEEQWSEASASTSDLVQGMNNAEAAFDVWEPTDDVGRIVQRAIRRILV